MPDPTLPSEPLVTPGTAARDACLRAPLLERRRRLARLARAGAGHEAHELLHQVDAALERIAGGSYGLCEICHDPVESERMIADPLTRVCLECLSEDQARALEKDLELASRIQGAMLPDGAVPVDGWEIRHRYQPHGLVSGDHLDVIPPETPGGPAHFVLGDVSGKGVAASMLMANLRAIFRSLVPLRLPLDAIVAQANRVFGESTLPSSYATLVLGRLHSSGGVELCNAGHPPPLLVRAGGVTPLPATGLPLGLFSGGRYELARFDLTAGDLLLLYTDGLHEAPDASDERYGTDRLAAAARELHGLPPAVSVERCLDDLRAFRNGHPSEDDLTLMAIGRSA